MSKRHKLIRVSEDKLRKDAKTEIKEFITSRYIHGKDSQLQDIQNEFSKPPYDLSEGSVINYLNELVEGRKLSTWKKKNLRYYGPPKIPLPIKIGIAASVLIITVGFIIDILVPPDWVYTYIYLGVSSEPIKPPYLTTRPIVIYMLIVTIVFTIIWYLSNRKVYK
jgi:hypothetical protein